MFNKCNMCVMTADQITYGDMSYARVTHRVLQSCFNRRVSADKCPVKHPEFTHYGLCADLDQETRLDVSTDNTDGVRSEYAILAPSRSGESSGTSLGDRLKLTKDMAPDLFNYLKLD